MCRTLDGVRQKLGELSRHHAIILFLSNADHRSEIIGFVEDIREAITNYQVLYMTFDNSKPGLKNVIDSFTEGPVCYEF
jgi:hypothetical protein